MKKELNKVLLLMSVVIVFIVGCNSKTKEIDGVEDNDNTKDISVNEPVKELPNLVFSTSIENLKIVTLKTGISRFLVPDPPFIYEVEMASKPGSGANNKGKYQIQCGEHSISQKQK